MLNNISNIINKILIEKTLLLEKKKKKKKKHKKSGWGPKNKKKHAACKAKVKASVKVWPSAYASGQVVRCYYGESTNMENLKKLFERQMTDTEMKKETRLHKKIPKQPFIDRYGEDKGENVYYATTKKMAMESSCGCEKRELIVEALKKAVKKSTSKSTTTKKKNSRYRNPRPGSPWFRHKVTRKLIKRGDKEGRSYLSSGQRAIQSAEFEKMRSMTPSEKLQKGARYGPAKKYIEVLGACATLRAQGKKCGGKKGSKLASKKKN